MLQLFLPDVFKVCFIFWVGSRPAAFDIMDPDLVKLFRDFDLIVERKGDAFGLRTVPQRCIVYGYTRHIISFFLIETPYVMP